MVVDYEQPSCVSWDRFSVTGNPGGSKTPGLIREVGRQHVVSQVVLKNFMTGRDKQLAVVDRRNPKRYYLRSPRAVGFVNGFVAWDSQSAERLWSKTEQRFGEAIWRLKTTKALASGSDDEQALRDGLALHWARSKPVRLTSDRAMTEVLAEHHKMMSERPDLLAALFKQQTGLDSTGPESLAWVNDDFHSHPLPEVESGEHFRSRVEYFFRGAQNRFRPFGVQVCFLDTRAPGGLIIGDAPLITVGKEAVALNPLQGIALGDAAGAWMPVSPGIAVSLHSRTEVIHGMSWEIGQQLNEQQRSAAVDQWFGRPDDVLQQP